MLFNKPGQMVRPLSGNSSSHLPLSSVHEICAAKSLNLMFLLCCEGSLTLCDSINNKALRSQQLLIPKGCDVHEIGVSPDASIPGDGTAAGITRNPAIKNVPLGMLKAQNYGRALVAWSKRAKAKLLCCSSPGETVLAVNHTAVDRTICYHDSLSGRLLSRVPLDMSFREMPELAEALLAGGGRGYCSGQGVDAEDGAVLDFCLQIGGAMSSELLFASLAGTSSVVVFHARSGASVAIFQSNVNRVETHFGRGNSHLRTVKQSSNYGVPPKLMLLLKEDDSEDPESVGTLKREFLVTGGGGQGDACIRLWDLARTVHPKCRTLDRVEVAFVNEAEERAMSEGQEAVTSTSNANTNGYNRFIEHLCKRLHECSLHSSLFGSSTSIDKSHVENQNPQSSVPRAAKITSVDLSGYVSVEYLDNLTTNEASTFESGIFVSRISMDVGGPPLVGDKCTVLPQIFSVGTLTAISGGSATSSSLSCSTGKFEDRFCVKYKDGRVEKLIRPTRISVISKHIRTRKRESIVRYGSGAIKQTSTGSLLPLPRVRVGDQISVEQPTLVSDAERDVEALLKRFDKTGTGEVEYSAFCRFLRDGLCMDLSRYRAAADGDVDTLEELEDDAIFSFCEVMDANGDGRISIRELSDAIEVASHRLGIAGQGGPLVITQPKYELFGHKGAVTTLSYHSKLDLLITAATDGSVLVWDAGLKLRRLVHPMAHAHVQVWPGYYLKPKVDWARNSTPFLLVARIDLAELNRKCSSSENSIAKELDLLSKNDKVVNANVPAYGARIVDKLPSVPNAHISYAVAMEPFTLDQQSPRCQVTLSQDKVLLAKELDYLSHSEKYHQEAGANIDARRGAPPSPAQIVLDDILLATGDSMNIRAVCESRSLAQATQRRRSQDIRCRGFVYLLSDGSIASSPSDHFDSRMVTLEERDNRDLSDAQLEKEEADGDANHTKEDPVPIWLKSRRGMVIRIIYVSSSKVFRSLTEFTASLRKSGAATSDKAALERFCKNGGIAGGIGAGETKVVIFYADGENTDILGSLPARQSSGDRSSKTYVGGKGLDGGESGEQPAFGMDKGTVTKVLGEGWFEVAYDHAIVEARVPRNRIHLPPSSKMEVGAAMVGSTKGIISEGARVYVSKAGTTFSTSSSLSTSSIKSKEQYTSLRSAANSGGNDLHVLSLVTLCPSTGEARLLTFALGKTHIAVAAIEMDEPCPPSTRRAVSCLFRNHWQKNLGIFRTRLIAALTDVRAIQGRNNRRIRSASSLLRRAYISSDMSDSVDMKTSQSLTMTSISKANLAAAAFHCGALAIRSQTISSSRPWARVFESDASLFDSETYSRERTMLEFARRIFLQTAAAFTSSVSEAAAEQVSLRQPQSSKGDTKFYESTETVPISPFVQALQVLVSSNPFARAVLPPALGNGQLEDMLDGRVVLSSSPKRGTNEAKEEHILANAEDNLSRVTWGSVKECMISLHSSALDIDETYALLSHLHALPNYMEPGQLKSLSVKVQMLRVRKPGSDSTKKNESAKLESSPSVSPDLFADIVTHLDPFTEANEACQQLASRLRGLQLGPPELQGRYIDGGDDSDRVFTTPGLAAEARRQQLTQSTSPTKERFSSSQYVLKDSQDVRGGLQRYVQSLYEQAWLTRITNIRKLLSNFKNSACNSATTLLLRYVNDGYNLSSVSKESQERRNSTFSSEANGDPAGDHVAISTFSMRKPLTIVEDRLRPGRLSYIGYGTGSDVGPGNSKKKKSNSRGEVPVVIMNIPNANLDMLQSLDGLPLRDHINWEIQMHTHLQGNEKTQDSVARLYLDANYVSSSQNVERDDEFTGTGGGDYTFDLQEERNSLRLCKESLDQWQSLSSILRQRGPLGSAELLPVARLWMSQLVCSLKHLHTAGILVRDLHTDNIFVSADGTKVKIGSLSLAGVMAPVFSDMDNDNDKASSITYLVAAPDLPMRSKHTAGPYAPPEQSPLFQNTSVYYRTNRLISSPDLALSIRGWLDNSNLTGQRYANPNDFARNSTNSLNQEKSVYMDAKYDIWQLGCLLYHLVIGHAPPSYTEAFEAYARQRSREESFALELPYFDFLSTIHAANSQSLSRRSEAQSNNISAANIHPNSLSIYHRNKPIKVAESAGGVRALSMLATGIGTMSLRAAVPQLGEAGSTKSSSRAKSVQSDPLSLSVAQKLCRHLRLRDQERRKHQQQISKPGSERPNTGMQALSILRKFDRSGDGVLSCAEFKKIILYELRFPMTSTEVEHVMRIVDTDRDGTVQLSELERFLASAQQISTDIEGLGGSDKPTASASQDILDILCMCLQPVPSNRPSAQDLSETPFFRLGKKLSSVSDKAAFLAAQRAASSYMSRIEPSLLVEEKFARPLVKWLRSLNPKALGESGSASHKQSGGSRETVDSLSEKVDISAFSDLCNKLCLYICEPPGSRSNNDTSTKAVSYSMDTDPVLLPSSARGPIIIEIFRRGILSLIVSIGLEVYSLTQSISGMGTGMGFVSGDPSDSIGLRVIQRVISSLRKIALQLRFEGAEATVVARPSHISSIVSAACQIFVGRAGDGRSVWDVQLCKSSEDLVRELFGDDGLGAPHLRPLCNWINTQSHNSSNALDDFGKSGDSSQTRVSINQDSREITVLSLPRVFKSRCKKGATYLSEMVPLGLALARCQSNPKGKRSRLRRSGAMHISTLLSMSRSGPEAGEGAGRKPASAGVAVSDPTLEDSAEVYAQRLGLCLDFDVPRHVVPLIEDQDPDVRKEALTIVTVALKSAAASIVPLSSNSGQSKESSGIHRSTSPAAVHAERCLGGLFTSRLATSAVTKVLLNKREESIENRARAVACLISMGQSGDEFTASWESSSVLEALAANIDLDSASSYKSKRQQGKTYAHGMPLPPIVQFFCNLPSLGVNPSLQHAVSRNARLQRILKDYGVKVPRPPSLEGVLSRLQESKVGGGTTGSLTVAECSKCVRDMWTVLSPFIAGTEQLPPQGVSKTGEGGEIDLTSLKQIASIIQTLWSWFDGHWERTVLDWDPSNEQALRISNARAEVCTLILNIFRRIVSQGSSQSGIGIRLLFMLDDSNEKDGKKPESIHYIVSQRLVSLVNKMSEDFRYERYVRHPLLVARSVIPFIISDVIDEALKSRGCTASVAMSLLSRQGHEVDSSELLLATRGQLERFDLAESILRCLASESGIGSAITRDLANSSTLLRRASIDGSGACEVHLLYWLPQSIASRRKLLQSLLKMDTHLCDFATWYPSPGGVIAAGSGLLDALLTTCLGDTSSSSKVQVDKYTLPADFVRYNRRWVVRDEALALLQVLVSHAIGRASAAAAIQNSSRLPSKGDAGPGQSNRAVATSTSTAGAFMREELVRNIVKYGVIEAERKRLWKFKEVSLQKTVVSFLRIVLRLGPGRGGQVDRLLSRSAGVPVELLELERRYPERTNDIDSAWRTWRTTMWQTRGRNVGVKSIPIEDGVENKILQDSGGNAIDSRREPLSQISKSVNGTDSSAATQARTFAQRISSGKYASSSEDDENDDDLNAIAAVSTARKLIAKAENTKSRLQAKQSDMSGTRNHVSSSSKALDRASMLYLRLTVIASTKSERSPEHPAWCDEVLNHLAAQAGDFDAKSNLIFVKAAYKPAPAGAEDDIESPNSPLSSDKNSRKNGTTNGKSDTLRAAERRRAVALGETKRNVGGSTRSILGKSKYSNLEAEMLTSTGHGIQYLDNIEHNTVGGPKSEKNYQRLVTLSMRASTDAAKQVWRAIRNGRIKLGGVGNAIGGRVRRIVMLQVEGMTALTGEGDNAPDAMLAAVGEGMPRSFYSKGKGKGHGDYGPDSSSEPSSYHDSTNESHDDSGIVIGLQGKGTLGKRGKLPSRWERLGMFMQRTRMKSLLDRLGDRVVDLRDAYESVTFEKNGNIGGGARVCCDDLMRLLWTIGVDDASEIVKDYETLLHEEYGEDTSAHLSFDDFLRIYDYHEQSMLGSGSGVNQRLDRNGKLRSSLKNHQSGRVRPAATSSKAGPGEAPIQAVASLEDMSQQQWIMTGDMNQTQSSRASAQGQALRAAFDKYDVDKDGLISFLDLRTRFRQMGRTNVPDLEIRRWIADKDRRGAGNVSFEEFERAYGHVKVSSSHGRDGGVRLGGTGISNGNVRNYAAYETGRNTKTPSDINRDVKSLRGADASDLKQMHESILEGRRAERELEDLEQKELLRLFNDNHELMVRARACFDRFDAYNRGVVPSDHLCRLLEHMGYR